MRGVYDERPTSERVSALLTRITDAPSEADALNIARGCTTRERRALCDLLYLDEIGAPDTLARRIVAEARG